MGKEYAVGKGERRIALFFSPSLPLLQYYYYYGAVVYAVKSHDTLLQSTLRGPGHPFPSMTLLHFALPYAEGTTCC